MLLTWTHMVDMIFKIGHEDTRSVLRSSGRPMSSKVPHARRTACLTPAPPHSLPYPQAKRTFCLHPAVDLAQGKRAKISQFSQSSTCRAETEQTRPKGMMKTATWQESGGPTPRGGGGGGVCVWGLAAGNALDKGGSTLIGGYDALMGPLVAVSIMSLQEPRNGVGGWNREREREGRGGRGD